MTQAWRLVVVTAAFALFPILANAALPKTAADMEAAKGADAVKIKDDILAAMPASPVERNEFARQVIKEFEAELDSANTDARLNTAILLENLQSLACDHVLEKMLTNKDPAVRLWGAKGLGNIAPILKKVGGGTLATATKALTDAQATEPSPVVKSQIDKALAQY